MVRNASKFTSRISQKKELVLLFIEQGTTTLISTDGPSLFGL
jgi:hypothetical protein